MGGIISTVEFRYCLADDLPRSLTVTMTRRLLTAIH
jgi:hypothetical protein